MSDDEKPKWADLFDIDPDWPVSDHERENHALHRILRDLIAELRDHCQQPSCNCDIGRAADYAETRLRRLRDD